MTSYAPGQINGSGPFINARKRAPIVPGAGRACAAARACGSGVAPASEPPVATTSPDAASPATCTNSRLFVFLAIVAPQNVLRSPGARRGTDRSGRSGFGRWQLVASIGHARGMCVATVAGITGHHLRPDRKDARAREVRIDLPHQQNHLARVVLARVDVVLLRT